MIFMHNYYAQPIYYTDVSKLCEYLTDLSIPLKLSQHIINANHYSDYTITKPIETGAL